MANVKITELSSATTLGSSDVFPVVDVGSTQTKKVTVTDLLRNTPDGTASAPSIANAGDQDTGILFPAENSVGVSTGGTQRLVINSSGNVGVGVANPQALLHISESGDTGTTRFAIGGTTGIDARTASIIKNADSPFELTIRASDNASVNASDIVFDDAVSERMRLDFSGNVGIGTSSPNSYSNYSTLTINGTTGGIIDLEANGTIFGELQALSNEFRINAVGASSVLKMYAGASERMRIDSSGRVGIGATSPAKLLEVRVTEDSSDGIRVNEIGDTYHDILASQGNLFIHADSKGDNGTQHVLRFGVGSSGERMRIDNSGNVGIGTSNPGQLIQIGEGDTGLGANVHTIARIEGRAVAGGQQVATLEFNQLTNASAEFVGASIGIESSAGTRSESELVFKVSQAANTNATEAMRLSHDGNVGIGTASPGEALHVVGTAQATQFESDGGAGSTGYDFSASGSGASVANVFCPASYTLGFGTQSTERMRINSSGQVHIGQTSATSVLGNGVSIKSNAVGSAYNTGALSLTGTAGDFYGLTFAKTASSTAEGFGFLAIFSGATDLLRLGYNSGSSNQNILDCYQNGNVNVVGALSKGSGSFRIDHPLPAKTETHNLVHSFIEGPQADLIYRGKVDLTAGAATVNLDTAARMTEGTFVLLNTNVQCFTTNESDWTAVRGSVSGNTLTIAAEDNTSTATVSWLVIGERQDQHMIDTDWTDDNGRVITEPEKPS